MIREQVSPRTPSAPAHRPRLPRAQVQLSLMALYLLPDASLCSFLRISSILAFPEPGHRPRDRARNAPRRPRHSSPLLSATADESRPLHATGHVSPAAATPVATPAGSGALTSRGTRGGGGGGAYLAPRRTWGTRHHPKVGICSWLPARLCPREFTVICEQKAGRGLVACANHLLGGYIPASLRLTTLGGR